MIVLDKKFIFNAARIVLEDDKISQYLDRKKYQRIVIISYQKLALGDDFQVNRKLTPIIHLDQELDNIFANFNDTTRNEIRKTFKNEELKFVAEDKNFDEIYELYKKFEYSQGRVPFSQKAMKDYLAFTAYYQNKLVSLILCFNSFPYLRARSICSKRLETQDREKYKIISNAGRRLVYEVCRYGQQRGYKLFDLGSINLEDKQKEGVAGFKSCFGGQLENEYTYTYKSKLYNFFEKFVAVKLFLLKIFNKFKI